MGRTACPSRQTRSNSLRHGTCLTARMYLPPHFAASHTDALALIRQYPLGALVHVHGGGLDANHIPWELEADTTNLRLIGHVARANPLYTQLHDGAAVLVIFQAEQAYVSPNWYPSKHTTHRQVPTWNYRVVHVHGTVCLHDDRKWVLGAVGKLTRTHEAPKTRARNRKMVGKLTRTHEARAQSALPQAAGPWKIKDAPPDYLDAMLAHIVGIEVVIERIEAKFKLSQNRSAEDRNSAAEAVSAAGTPLLGDAMRPD